MTSFLHTSHMQKYCNTYDNHSLLNIYTPVDNFLGHFNVLVLGNSPHTE